MILHSHLITRTHLSQSQILTLEILVSEIQKPLNYEFSLERQNG